MAARRQLQERHFDTDVASAMLSDTGRKLVVQTVRDELASSVQHRALGRPVAYDELLYLDALKLTRSLLEGAPYRPFRIWWQGVYVIVVYDTAAVRNARVLRTCRRYLHHVQRSVFEGNLTPAQLRRFEHRIEDVIDSAHDHVLIYTLPPGADAERRSLGAGWAAPTDIL